MVAAWLSLGSILVGLLRGMVDDCLLSNFFLGLLILELYLHAWPLRLDFIERSVLARVQRILDIHARDLCFFASRHRLWPIGECEVLIVDIELRNVIV